MRSLLANGSGLDSAENVGTDDENKSSVVVVDDDNHDEDDDDGDCNNTRNDESDGSRDFRLRRLFDEVLSLFVKAVGEKGMFRPLPAILDCEEKPVDLFRLFGIVRGRGGYGSVSKRRLWGFAARELGFRVRASAAVKLVYYKYLSELEKWIVDREKFGWNFRLLSSELEAEFRGSLPEVVLAQPRLDGGGGENVGVERWKECKRKRECFSEMLKWLKEMAKLSSGGTVGMAGEESKVEENDGEEFFDQAMRAREVLLLRRHVDSIYDESSSQKKPKMHPLMYQDQGARNHHASERLRCSKRVPNAAKSRLCLCCNTCSPNNPHKPADPDNEPYGADSPPVQDAAEDCPPDEPPESRVSVGPHFQAEVPEWTGGGAAQESDPKWLGTPIWPPPEREERDDTSVGKGRRGLCWCPFPGSGECVRFHVAEARMRLKLELGPVFFAWKLHRSGEEVSLGWTPEEEAKFKDAVMSGKSFGDRKTWWWLLRKPRESLVSYYFNVFLVRKRSYQNRVTPRDIDSDDDEAEFGSIGGGFGNGPADLAGPGFVACVQNRQCADVEETKRGSEIKPFR